jgi:hypothetical protein
VIGLHRQCRWHKNHKTQNANSDPANAAQDTINSHGNPPWENDIDDGRREGKAQMNRLEQCVQ